MRLRTGDPIIIRREPDNRHDAGAIALHAACGTRIGYLPRATASDLAPLLDGGLAATACISEARGTDIVIALSGPAVDALPSSTGAPRTLVL